MLIQVGEKLVEATPFNAHFLYYDNDILNGMYVDLETSYCFFSAHTEVFQELADKAMAHGITGYQFEAGQYDLNEEPHKYVVHALANMVVGTALNSLA